MMLIQDRVKAAAKLVDQIKRDSKNRSLGALTIKMEALWNALITFANTTERANTMMTCPIPNDQKIRQLKALETVAVPTASIPLSITGDYKDSVVGNCL